MASNFDPKNMSARIDYDKLDQGAREWLRKMHDTSACPMSDMLLLGIIFGIGLFMCLLGHKMKKAVLFVTGVLPVLVLYFTTVQPAIKHNDRKDLSTLFAVL